MKKGVIVVLIMLLLCVVSVSDGFFIANIYAIPSLPPPPEPPPPYEHHPHWTRNATHGLTSYIPNINGTVTWAADWDACVQNPNNIAHQHHCAQDFGGRTIPGGAGWPPRGPNNYEACCVWDNRQYRTSTRASFERGHGFINEWLWLGGGRDCIPRYRFSDVTQAGHPINWTDPVSGVDIRDLIRQAFSMYNGTGTDQAHLIVGIDFVEFDPARDVSAEIVIYWEDIGYQGVVSNEWNVANAAPINVTFDSIPHHPWNFTIDPTNIPLGQKHFFTVALHEVGHVVGLDEQDDTDDIMYYMTRAEAVYNDTDGNGRVSVGDIRYLDPFMVSDACLLDELYGANSVVGAGDIDSREPAGGRQLVPFAANERHVDPNGNGAYDAGELVYLDMDMSGNVTAGDVRLWSGTIRLNEKHRENIAVNNRYDPGEFIYRDNDNDNWVSVDDQRLTAANGYAAGTIVATNDTDEGFALINIRLQGCGSTVAAGDADAVLASALIAFRASEKHEEFPAAGLGRYDILGPWLGTLDSDTVHGVRDLYSIPQYDLGDAPDPYPVKYEHRGAYARVIDKEWLGPPNSGNSTTTMERLPRQINEDYDDGCAFTIVGTEGTVRVTISVTNRSSPRYTVPGYCLYLAIWIDYDYNMNWESSERIVLDDFFPEDWTTNTYTVIYHFSVPQGMQDTWARARLVHANSSEYLETNFGDEALVPHDQSPDNGGEIEDYPLHVICEPQKEWNMFGCDPTRARYSTSPGPCSNKTLWTHKLGGSIISSSPAIADGKVYIGSYDNKIYCLDAETGKPLWNFTTGDWVESSPAVANGKVFVGSWDGNLYALDAKSGESLWNHTTLGAIISSPAVANGKVFVCSSLGDVYALDTNGTFLWSSKADDFVYSSPAVADGKVFFGCWDKCVYALNATNGDLVWKNSTGERLTYSSPAVVDGRVYIGSMTMKGNIFCLNAQNGIIIWNYTTTGPIKGSPAVTCGKVFVGSYDGNVYAINATSGELIWQYTAGDYIFSSPAIACKQKLFIATENGTIYSLHPANGTVLWTYKANSSVSSSPAIASNTLFIGSGDGTLYAFRYLHDIAITNIVPSKTVVAEGYGHVIEIDVTIKNKGDFIEEVNLIFTCANSCVIPYIWSVAIDKGTSLTITFLWDTTGFAKGNYIISAYAWPVPGETDTLDNTLTDGWIIVAMPGDITGPDGWPDRKVDMRDIYPVARGFGAEHVTDPNDPRYCQYWHKTPCGSCPHTPNADINSDGKIDMRDIYVVARNFGKTDP